MPDKGKGFAWHMACNFLPRGCRVLVEVLHLPECRALRRRARGGAGEGGDWCPAAGGGGRGLGRGGGRGNRRRCGRGRGLRCECE